MLSAPALQKKREKHSAGRRANRLRRFRGMGSFSRPRHTGHFDMPKTSMFGSWFPDIAAIIARSDSSAKEARMAKMRRELGGK